MTPKRPDHAISLEIPIGFHQCDPLGVLWHGRYFELFEFARGKLLESVDLGVPVIRDMGYLMYVTEARCRYMAPLVFGDTARVTAWFGDLSPLLRVSYDVHNLARGTWSARATTVLATTDQTGALLPRTPDDMLARLPAR